MTDSLQAIARLAADHHTHGTSAAELVDRSGYRARRPEVTAVEIADALEAHPNWLAAWARYVDDNRGWPEWTVGGSLDSGWRVFYSDPTVPGRETPLNFETRIRAYAEYVKRHVDDIANMLDRDDATATPDLRLWRALRADEDAAARTDDA